MMSKAFALTLIFINIVPRQFILKRLKITGAHNLKMRKAISLISC